MRAVFMVAYVAMAVWLLVSSVLRVLILLRLGSALDPLPFVGAGLGVVALAAAVIMTRRHPAPATSPRPIDDGPAR